MQGQRREQSSGSEPGIRSQILEPMGERETWSGSEARDVKDGKGQEQAQLQAGNALSGQ